MNKATLKRLNIQNGWTYGPSPEDGEWYWVAFDNGVMCPAIAEKGRVGGWYNRDTWEDFDGEVIAFQKIQKQLFKV